MNEQKKKVLITSLGLAPGVVTTAVDVLLKDQVKIDKVVTLSTRGMEERVELLEDEFKKHYKKILPNITYEHDCIRSKNLAEIKACEDFLVLAIKHIDQHNEDGYDVYVSLAGGRKSMSGILALVTQFYGAEALFHIAIMNDKEAKKIDDNGDNLNYVRSNRKTMLHPESSRIVKMPFLNLRKLTKGVIASLEREETSKDIHEVYEFFKKYDVDLMKTFEEIATYDKLSREEKYKEKDPTKVG